MKMRSIPLLVSLGGVCLAAGVLSARKVKDASAVSAEDRVKVAEALPTEIAPVKKKRRLLVYSETKGYRHKSIDIGKFTFALMGQKTGAYEAVVSNDLANFEAGAIEKFDAICFLNTTLEVFRPRVIEMMKLGAEERSAVLEREARLVGNLLKFVKDGGGFIGVHAATDTLYGSPEYGMMLGGYFDGHPWRWNTDVSIKVAEGASGNPLVASLGGESLSFKEEIYQLKKPYDSSKLTMLLRLDTEKSDMKVSGIKRKDGDFGVSWTKSYGKGRVFYCGLGHNEHIYWNPKVLSVYLNGVQWALGDLQVKGE